MPVSLIPTIEVAAVPAKTFDLKFYTLLEARPTPTSAPVRFQWCPMSSSTNEVDYTNPHTFDVDLWQAAQAVPEAATALNALLEAFPVIEEWIVSNQ